MEINAKHEEDDRGQFWNCCLMNAFDEKEFVCVVFKQFYGLYLTVWVKKYLVDSIEDIKLEKCNSEKGIISTSKASCLACRFKLFGKTFCFVNTKLVEGHGKTKQRNQQYNHFKDNIKFGEGMKILDHK